MKRIKIAFLTVNDPLDKRSWSGTTYYVGQALQKNVGDVDFLGPVALPKWLDKTLRIMTKLVRKVFKKDYITKYSLLFGWYAARTLKKRMKGKHYDLVVAPAASTEFAFFKTSVPSVYYTDTTFGLISKFYKNDFANASAITLWEGNVLERRSLKKSSLAILTSNWARQSVIDDYGIDPKKALVGLLAANVDAAPPKEVIYRKEENKRLTLLFLAVEWERKGGPIAFDTLKQLHKKGIDAKLIVCGCVPPAQFSDEDMEVIPFLNKNLSADYQKFVQLLSTSHFLILPTRADCSLVVGCEASSYGMPTLSTQVGGVCDIIIDGVNGYCLPLEAKGDQYAELAATIFADKKRYHKLIVSSRERFEMVLNWDSWAQRFSEAYQKHILKIEEPRLNHKVPKAESVTKTS